MKIWQVFNIISFIWIASEITLLIMKRSKKGSARGLDRASLILLWLTIIISIFMGVFLGVHRIGFISFGHRFLSISGIILIVVGLIIRWVAILILRKYFTVNVAVSKNQVIVEKGPYAYVRHPSYLGSLLSFLGLGLAFSNWLSILIITIPIFFAHLYRIRVEEEALINAFGGAYIEYSRKTKRLIPWIY